MRFPDVERITDQIGGPLMRSLNQIRAARDDFIEAWTASGGTDQDWADRLFNHPRVEGYALSVTAASGTIAAPANSGGFGQVRPGVKIKLSGFTNGGNNVEKVVATRPSADSITVTDNTGLVDETGGGDEIAQVRANAEEVGVVADYIAFWQEMLDLINFYEGSGVPSQQDRRPEFQRVLSL